MYITNILKSFIFGDEGISMPFEKFAVEEF